jgi:single-stranded DNA-binding protein
MSELKNPMTALLVLQGRVRHAPKISGGDKPRANFSVANDYRQKDKDGKWETVTQFVDVVAFGYSAKDSERLTRGEQVQVTGTLRIEQWKGTNDSPRTSVKLLADTVRSMQWPDKDVRHLPVDAVSDLEPRTEQDDIPF